MKNSPTLTTAPLGPHASSVPTPHTINSETTAQGLSALPQHAPDPLNHRPATEYDPSTKVFSALNSPISASSVPLAAYRENGHFAPANPWRFQPGSIEQVRFLRVEDLAALTGLEARTIRGLGRKTADTLLQAAGEFGGIVRSG